MTDQGMMKETSLSTSESISNESSRLSMQENDTSVKQPCNFKNEEESALWIEKKLEKGDILGKEHTDDSTAKKPSPLERETGEKISQAAKEAIITVPSEEKWKDIPVYSTQVPSSAIYATVAATGTQSTILNAFICDSSDSPLCNTEENLSNGLENLYYPPTFDSTERRGMEDKPYGCKYCIRRFAHSSSLYRHQKSHMETKLYKCTQCDKAFTSASNLNVHSRIHTGLKPYECSDCGKRFTRKFGLDQHLKIHSQEKLYICSHCGKSYTDYFFLVKHQQMERASVPYS
ncbi:uncharacterized protein ACMZJ9_018519 [Mantella aurantiaca]